MGSGSKSERKGLRKEKTPKKRGGPPGTQLSADLEHVANPFFA